MKRKASALDEPVSTSDWASIDYALSSTSTSPESVKAFTEPNYRNPHWNVGAIPYLNSRTRKRYRDGRPDEEAIHQKTLAKLFNAQRQIHAEHNQQGYWQGNTNSVSPLNYDSPLSSMDVSMQDTESLTLGQPEKNQRSIDSFFGAPSTSHVQRRPQHTSFAFNSLRTPVQPMPTCDDCSATLQSVDLDVSMACDDLTSMSYGLQHDEWACASCYRRVCNTCAVQGNQRICLECAVPGGG